MKKTYLFGLCLVLFTLFSCSSDDDDNVGGNSGNLKRVSRIEEVDGDDDYTSFSYNNAGKLEFIEIGDEDGMFERLQISYDAEGKVRTLTFNDTEVNSVLNVTYDNNIITIEGTNSVFGTLNEKLTIDPEKETLLKLEGQKNITYTYADGNVISSTDRSGVVYSYNNDKSILATTGAPKWLLNFIYEYYDFIDDYVGENNIKEIYYNEKVSHKYTYEYKNGYATKLTEEGLEFYDGPEITVYNITY